MWRHAVKKPGLSGYDLWLMEATYCAKQGLYFPDVPSHSGGWSKYAAIPGENWQPPADCVVAPITIGNYITRCWEDAEHTKLLWLTFHGIDPASFPGHMIVDPTWMLWQYDPDDRSSRKLFTYRFDNWAGGVKIWNPIYPRRCAGLCIIFVKSTIGTLMVYEQDRTQPDGLDQPSLDYCTHITQWPYLARGKWE